MSESLSVKVIEKIEGLVEKATDKNLPIYTNKEGEEFFTGTKSRVAITYKDSKGVERYTENKNRVYPKKYRETIETQSLQSIVDYVKESIESQEGEKLFIVVNSIKSVSLYVETDEYGKRHELIRASMDRTLKQFEYDYYQEPEEFVVGLYSLFEVGHDEQQAIQKASSLTLQNTVNQDDNGNGYKGSVSQEVKTGNDTHIFNLAPFRTFREIKQPVSMFVFRTKKNLSCALFEADGGAWRIEAMNSIKKWLSEKLEGINVIG